jgi:hypothetical protein
MVETLIVFVRVRLGGLTKNFYMHKETLIEWVVTGLPGRGRQRAVKFWIIFLQVDKKKLIDEG